MAGRVSAGLPDPLKSCPLAGLFYFAMDPTVTALSVKFMEDYSRQCNRLNSSIDPRWGWRWPCRSFLR